MGITKIYNLFFPSGRLYFVIQTSNFIWS